MGLETIIKKLAKNNDEVYSLICKVDSVDSDKKTVDVSPINGDAAVFGVRLQADLSASLGVCIYPKKDSNVVVTFLNKDTAYVALVSEFDKVEINVGSQAILIDQEGMSITGFLKLESSSTGLKNVFDSLLDALASIIITSPAGPCTVDPGFIAQMNILKSQLSTFLK